jgi:hypothetical protein
VPKRIGQRTWVHRTALGELPAAQRERVRAVTARAPGFTWTVARVGPESVMLGRTTSFDDAHPELLESVTWKGGRLQRRTYSDPPIYHRVETMLPAGDPRRERHAAQTTREQAAGLLSRPDIGRRSSWRRVKGSRSALFERLRGRATPTPQTRELWATHYTSGVTQRADLEAMAACGRPVGVSMAELGHGASVDLMMAMSRWRPVPLFIDTGAVREASSGVPMTHAVWRERLDRIEDLVRRARALQADAGLELPILVVAPDKVGDQDESLERLARYRARLVRLRELGATILVPLQPGALPLAELDRAVDRVLGPGLRGWVPAIPMRQGVVAPAQLGEYLAAAQPQRLHLLGVGPNSPMVTGRRAPLQHALAHGRRDVELTMDSVIVRASSVARHHRAGAPAHERALERLAAGRGSGYPGLAGPPMDYTDEIGLPSGYTSDAQRERIARQAGLGVFDRAAFIRDPEGALARGVADEHPELWVLLDEAYTAHAAAEQRVYARAQVLCEVIGARGDLSPEVILKLPR